MKENVVITMDSLVKDLFVGKCNEKIIIYRLSQLLSQHKNHFFN